MAVSFEKTHGRLMGLRLVHLSHQLEGQHQVFYRRQMRE
jgi:hypothetical protein